MLATRHAIVVFCLCLSVAAHAGQMDFRVFRLLTTGMTEAEVLQRAGPPDDVSADTSWVYVPFSPYPQPVQSKRLFYYADPSSHDPHLTIISLTDGQIINLERQRVNSRSIPGTSRLAPPPVGDPYDSAGPGSAYGQDRQNVPSDPVLRAARELRDIRERNQPPSSFDPESKIHRWIDSKGIVHYGDREPQN